MSIGNREYQEKLAHKFILNLRMINRTRLRLRVESSQNYIPSLPTLRKIYNFRFIFHRIKRLIP